MARRPVITIDGPAGSGKTSTAQEGAKGFGLRHLDSGALYRALTFALLKDGVPQREWSTLESEQLAELRVEAIAIVSGSADKLTYWRKEIPGNIVKAGRVDKTAWGFWWTVNGTATPSSKR